MFTSRTLAFRNEVCRTYRSFYEAIVEYKSHVGYRPPFAIKNNTGVTDQDGKPYELYDDIKFSKGTFMSTTTATYEMGHAIRHTYDGSYSHVLYDAARFYPRTHVRNKCTNNGFALKEGWAGFWAENCSNIPSGSMAIEGNVAVILRNLKTRFGTNFYRMWEELLRNP